MSCLLNTNNTSMPLLAAGAQIPFGSVIHRKGRAVTLEGNEIFVRGGCNDYATVTGSVNLVPTAEGEVAVTLLVDGVAQLTVTGTAGAAGDYVNLPFVLSVKGSCCGLRRITATVSAAATVAAFPVVVETA